MTSNNKCKLYLVDLGPGDEKFLTPSAVAALRECDTVMGYRLYIQQVQEMLSGKQQVPMELGQGMEWASAEQVAGVISSGDPGIYGMADPARRQPSKTWRAWRSRQNRWTWQPRRYRKLHNLYPCRAHGHHPGATKRKGNRPDPMNNHHNLHVIRTGLE